MAAKPMLAACIMLLPLLTGMRDPFQPVPDRCQIAQMTHWHWQGVVAVNGQHVGIVRDPAGNWRRIRQGESLFAGWRVAKLNKEEIALVNTEGCSPARWCWKRKGIQDDKTTNNSCLPLAPDEQRQHKGTASSTGDSDS